MFNAKLNGKLVTEVTNLQLATDGLRENENGYLYWVMRFKNKPTQKECVYLSKRTSKVYSVGDKPSNLQFNWVEYEDGREARLKLGFGETEFVDAGDL
jgi:hypothetical protein